jgi:hypothetical protein
VAKRGTAARKGSERPAEQAAGQPVEPSAGGALAEADGQQSLISFGDIRSRVFVRNFSGGELLEIFMVFAVSAVLGIRFALDLSGYPQLGGAGLHIAHLLWGGLLMMIALVLLMVYLGQRIMHIAAVVGGLGFGVFVDELGKFITSDNDYFYRPAMAIIYLVFIALFVVLRAVQRQRIWSSEAYLMNALVLLQEAVLHDLDTAEHRRALAMLQRAKQGPGSPVAPLEAFLAALEPIRRRASALSRLLRWINRRVHRVLASVWLARLVSVIFCLRGLAFILATVAILASLAGSGTRPTPMEIVAFVAAFISNALGLLGVANLLRSRLNAFVWFKRSIIVSIFIADVFAFYEQQLAAVFSLALDVALYVVLNELLRHEPHRAADKQSLVSPVEV